MNIGEYKAAVIEAILRAAVSSKSADKALIARVAHCVLVCSENGYDCAWWIDDYLGLLDAPAPPERERPT